MARRRTVIVGRQRERAQLDVTLRTEPAEGRLVVLLGPAGIGRSALLDSVARAWRGEDAEVITVRHGTSSRTDPLGIAATVAALRQHYERLGDRRRVDSIGALGRLGPVATAKGHAHAAYVRAELDIMFEQCGSDRRTALLVDDAQALAAPVPVLAAARRAGCVVVAACRDDRSAGAGALVDTADEVIELGPLAEDDVETLLTQVLGMSADDALLPALRTALGPLFGHPGTLLATLDELRARDRLVALRDRLCLRERGAPVPLPADHALVLAGKGLDEVGRRLLALAAATEDFRVDDLPAFAEATGGELGAYGRAADALVDAGLLVTDEQARVRCCCPALAAAVIESPWLADASSLRAAFAAKLLRDKDSGDHPPGAVADRVAEAGRELPPDPRAVDLLVAEADRVAGVDPARAARRFRAALWHGGPTHPGRSAALAGLLRLLVRAGRYAELGDVVAEAIAVLAPAGAPSHPVATPGEWADLAAAAVLAALHAGHPVPDESIAALAGRSPAGDAAVAFCGRWFAGLLFTDADAEPVAPEPAAGREPLLSPGELALVAAAATGRPAAVSACGGAFVAGRAADLVEAGSTGDLVDAFRLVLGSRYGEPTDGALAAYHRVRRGYAHADWAGALSAARELELVGAPDSPVHQLGRVHAAEICAARGEPRRAATWLEPVPEDGPFAAARAWAATGIVFTFGDRPGAVTTGWRAYLRARSGAPLGQDRLLLRLVGLNYREKGAGADRFLAELEELDRRLGNQATRQAAHLARGLARGDVSGAWAGVGLARRRGHQPDLLLACLVAARLAADPEPWYLEAHELARRLGSAALRGQITGLMRERGIATPRHPLPREPFSATELRIIELIRYGHTNRQIAVEVRVSEKTVENHLTRLFARTGCRSRLELVAASLEGRLVAVE